MEFYEFDFMPHGHCYFWRPEIVWSHAISDAIIAVSYFIIPYGLIKLIRRRPDLKYRNLFLLFGLFIVACGATHILSIINIWEPFYRIDAIVKVITALASLPTAIVLLKILPEAVRIPSPAMWEQANKELQAQIMELKEKDKTIEKVKEFEFLADSIPQLIWTISADEKNRYYNSHWSEYSDLDMKSTGTWDPRIVHSDDVAKSASIWTAAKETGEPFVAEYRFKRRKDGQYRWHLGRGVPMKDEKGNIIKWFGTCTDIHDLKMAQKEANEANAKFQILVSNAPLIIWAVDMEGKFTILEGKGLKEANLNSEEIVGKPYKEMRKDFPKMWERNIERALKGEEVVDIAESDEIIYETNFGPLKNAEGEIVGMVGVSLDITKRKKAESESQFKSRFLASMSHEIRTPLNAVIGFANVLKKSSLTAEQQEYVDFIDKSGELLLKLIGDVLDLSKIEEGKLTIERQSFHLKESISSSLYPYKFTAKESGIVFDLIFGDDLPERLFGDSYRINQVLINLIGNAIKFSKGGKIEVIIEKIRTIKNVVSLKFSVADSGIGIPDEKKLDVFKSFTQADANTHKIYGGSGLGLSIVEQLVRLMGTKIHVDSPHTLFQEPIGSCFWFILDLETDTTTNAPRKIDTSMKNFENKVKVLLVEDNEVNQILANLILRNIGCQVDFANNGQECLEMIARNEYSCILMDVQMPVMDGLEATKAIRKEGNMIPIVGLSANVYKDDIEKSLQAGMNSHLGKPYTEEQIFEAILKSLPVAPKSEKLEKITDISSIYKLSEDKLEISTLLEKSLFQAQDYLVKMRGSVEKEDWKELAFYCHAYKSSARIIGATTFQLALQEMEEAAKMEDKKKSVDLFERVQDMCLQIQKELKESLNAL